jgi:urea transporter
MISIPLPGNDEALSRWQTLLRGLPRAYAILFFSPDRRLGWMLLAISLLAPDVGLCGLAGVFAAGGLALALGFDRARIRNGYFLFNPLLVCLTVGWMNRAHAFPWPTFIALWIAGVVGGFFIAVALQQWISQQFGLSPQSLPATAVAYFLYFLAVVVTGPALFHFYSETPWLDLPFLPPYVRAFFQTFGSMLFEPHVLPGILVVAALAWASPLALIIAAGSFAVGVGTMSLMGFPSTPEGVTWCGFNFLLCGIALGSSYFAPSRASLLLALVGAFLCALVALALSSALGRFGLPASALPYNLVVLTLVYALRQRTSAAGLHPSPSPGMLPETAGRFVVLNASRFPHLNVPALALPLQGECIVTQGCNGSLTHRAPWNWAFDLEMLREGRRWKNSGEELEDYHVFDQPVLAPCDGTIAVVVNHVRDNRPGSNNPEQNWGNQVVLYADAGYYVLLAHLRQNSVIVVPGQRVGCGQPLARCGNSGRSPVPHVHLQVQYTPYPGAATRPFCLHHYAEVDPASSALRYITSGMPAESTRIVTPAVQSALPALFSNWLPGEYRYRVMSDEGTSREETVLLDFDDAGRFRLRSRRHHARLTAFLSGGVFYMVDYEGAGESVLALFSVGLARVPGVAPGIGWHDFASAVPFYGGIFRRVHELADPFVGPGLLPYDYTIEADGADFQIRAHLRKNETMRVPARTIQRITTTVVPRFGVERMEARLWNDTQLTVELLEPFPGRTPGQPAGRRRNAAVPESQAMLA